MPDLACQTIPFKYIISDLIPLKPFFLFLNNDIALDRPYDIISILQMSQLRLKNFP